MKNQILLALSVLCVAAPASGAGFFLNDHGAKATGRAGAVTATVTDGSAIFYNPGGIGAASGYSLYLGGTFISPNAEYEARDENFELTGDVTKISSGYAITPNIYLSGAITDMVKVGLGFNTPFGSRIAWPEDSPGGDVIQEQSLRTFFISPVLGLDLGQWVEGLSLGGGPDFVPATAYLRRDLQFGDAEGSAELGGTAFGIGGRVGLMYKPLEKVSIGLAYRSEVELTFEGDADVDMESSARGTLPPDGPVTLAVTLPQSVLGGVAVRPVRGLEIEVDFNWVGWSSYNELDVEFADGSHSTAPKDWNDTLAWRVGLEYDLSEAGAGIRAGYAYDPTPMPRTTQDFTLVDADRHVVSLGGSYDLPEGLFVDLGLLYVLPGERNTARADYTPKYKGTYRLSAFVAALSIGYNFGGDDAPAVDPGATAAN